VAHPVCPRRQPSAIVVGQTQPTPAKLATQEPVFFDEVDDRPLLPVVQPASKHTQDHLQRCGFEHEPKPILRAGLKDVGRVLEHYERAQETGGHRDRRSPRNDVDRFVQATRHMLHDLARRPFPRLRAA
jgi:hypothetical protein